MRVYLFRVSVSAANWVNVSIFNRPRVSGLPMQKWASFLRLFLVSFEPFRVFVFKKLRACYLIVVNVVDVDGNFPFVSEFLIKN